MCFTMAHNGKRYTEEFKRQIIDLYLAGKPVAQLAEEYGLVVANNLQMEEALCSINQD